MFGSLFGNGGNTSSGLMGQLSTLNDNITNLTSSLNAKNTVGTADMSVAFLNNWTAEQQALNSAYASINGSSPAATAQRRALDLMMTFMFAESHGASIGALGATVDPTLALFSTINTQVPTVTMSSALNRQIS